MRRVSGIGLLTFIALAVIVLSACGSRGELRPLHAEEDTGGIIGDQPQLVTFAELQADPEAYKNMLVRVTGTYYRLSPPDCLLYSGPDTNWSLFADNLRLDSQGFERSIQIVPDGVELTVDGIFRKYEGPLGCGKRPEPGIVWFLETTQIVQPNPLSRVIGTSSSGQPPGAGSPTPPGTLPAISSTTPTIVTSPFPTSIVPTATPTLAITTIGTATPMSSPTSGTSIPTVTPTPTLTLGPGTPSVTPSSTPTSLPGTFVPSPTNTAPPTLGPTQPPLSTSTPGSYPLPPTPVNSPSPPTAEPSPTGYP